MPRSRARIPMHSGIGPIAREASEHLAAAREAFAETLDRVSQVACATFGEPARVGHSGRFHPPAARQRRSRASAARAFFDVRRRRRAQLLIAIAVALHWSPPSSPHPSRRLRAPEWPWEGAHVDCRTWRCCIISRQPHGLGIGLRGASCAIARLYFFPARWRYPRLVDPPIETFDGRSLCLCTLLALEFSGPPPCWRRWPRRWRGATRQTNPDEPPQQTTPTQTTRSTASVEHFRPQLGAVWSSPCVMAPGRRSRLRVRDARRPQGGAGSGRPAGRRWLRARLGGKGAQAARKSD